MNIGDKVIYRGLGGSRPEATVNHVYEGECAGELALIVDIGSGPDLLERVPQWDGRTEHIQCWQPKEAA